MGHAVAAGKLPGPGDGAGRRRVGSVAESDPGSVLRLRKNGIRRQAVQGEAELSQFLQTVAAERALLSRMTGLNRRFSALLGTVATRDQLDVVALADQGHVLAEELAAIHRAYQE